MKIKLLLCSALIASQIVYAQQPTKPNDQLMRTNVEGVKAISIGENDTTSKLPPGVKFVKGKITVKSGYKAVYSSDKKMVFIMSRNNPNVNGSFACGCISEGGGSCSLTIAANVIFCSGDDCCRLVVTQSDLSGVMAKQEIEEAPEKLTWKRIVFPKKSN